MIKKILCALAAAAMLLQPAAQAVTRQKIDARMFSDEKYIFRIQGSDKKFLLLDESDDTESKFFVVALDYYGEKAYHNGGKSKFDPKDPESIAYYLNNDFIKTGNSSSIANKTYKLPQAVIDYIDYEHIWQCEEAGSDAPEPYKIECGIALLSQTELIQYADKIGWDDGFKTVKYDFLPKPWAIRTTDSAYAENYNLAIRPDVDKTMINWLGLTPTAIGIRPCFWLDIDFFRDNAVELSTLGSGVKTLFKKYYTIDEMLELYTRQECYDYLGYTPEITLEAKDNVLMLKNNRKENISGIIMLTYFDEGNIPVAQSNNPLWIGAEELQTASINVNAPEKARYVRVNVIAQGMPSACISNSIRINL